MAENDIVALKELASGGFLEVALAPADIAAASSTHASTHHTGGSDALTPASISAAPAVTVIELTPSPGSTTITTSQLPARGIAYIEGGGSFTVNLPTPDKRQSGLTFSIKVEHEGASGDVFITVVHNASDLLTSYELDEDESSLDFLWDGYRWTYSNANWLYSYPNRRLVIPPLSGTLGLSEPSDTTFRVVGSSDATKKVAFEVDGLTTATTRTLTVPNASGTLALTSDFAAPPAIGNTTPAAISGTTGTFTTLTATPSSGSALTLTGGTVTASAPLISATQTWNDGAVTFTGLAATITNTASATASLVARFTVGSTNVFEVDGRGFTTLRKVATTTDFVNMFTARRGTTQIFALRDDGAVSANSYSTNAGGGGASFISDDGFAVRSSGSFRISSDTTAFTPDVYLRRDAAGVFAQYNGTNAQEYRVYGTYTSATNYQRLAIKTKSITLSALSGASVATTGGFIPDGAVLVGLTTRVSTAITGATGYDIGDGSDADRWGANVAIALNTSSDNTNWTAGTIECFTAAQEVTLTAVGSNFTGGAVVIVAHYLAGEAD